MTLLFIYTYINFFKNPHNNLMSYFVTFLYFPQQFVHMVNIA